MKIKGRFGIFSILCYVFLFAGCEQYPDQSDYVTEQLIAVTNYDTNMNFASKKTYFLSDTVAYFDSESEEPQYLLISEIAKLKEVADQIKKNVESKLGYDLVSSGNADVFMTLSLAKTTTYVYSSGYPWWWYDYCYYFWGCGYYPYYPYPYPVVVGGYDAGTAVMDMFDTANPDYEAAAMWTGVVRGLYTDSHTMTEMKSAIDDCFNQTQAFN